MAINLWDWPNLLIYSEFLPGICLWHQLQGLRCITWICSLSMLWNQPFRTYLEIRRVHNISNQNMLSSSASVCLSTTWATHEWQRFLAINLLKKNLIFWYEFSAGLETYVSIWIRKHLNIAYVSIWILLTWKGQSEAKDWDFVPEEWTEGRR